MSFELALHELLPVNYSIQLVRPQRRLCRQISIMSVGQNSQYWTPGGDASVPDHCYTPALNR